VIRHDVGKVLRKLEELQERQIEKTLIPEKPAMPTEEQAEALALLKDPNLLDRCSPTSPAAGWWAKKPTSSSAI
jgi:hypothetical protein